MNIFKKMFQTGTSVSPQRAREMMREDKGVILLDVRAAEEYNQVHIPNAKLLPVGSIRSRAVTELPDKDAKILVYCHSGARAKRAVQELSALGYTGAANLGGIINWPYETVRGAAK